MDDENEATQASEPASEVMQEVAEETHEPAPRGTPESAAWFRAMLVEIGETQASLARLMKRKGDDRKLATIERNIRRIATGHARVSGEMRVVLTMMRSGKRQAEKRAATKAAECQAAGR